MSVPSKRLGDLGEAVAQRFLEREGYQIQTTNFRTREGEIDIIAQKDGTLVFVEVRARTTHSFGPPEESITPAKKRHLIATAQGYLQQTSQEQLPWRIDLIALDIHTNGNVRRIHHLQNALTQD